MSIERGPSTLSSLRAEVRSYLSDLRRFLTSRKLERFIRPIDHAAVKAKDLAEYKRILDQLVSQAKIIVVTKIEGRQIAVAQLAEQLSFGDLGPTQYLEVIEPKRGARVNTAFWMQHLEMVYTPFSEVVKFAQQLGVVPRDHGAHKTLDFELNDWEQEIKFSNRPIEEVLLEQVSNRTAQIYFQKES